MNQDSDVGHSYFSYNYLSTKVIKYPSFDFAKILQFSSDSTGNIQQRIINDYL